MIHRFSSWYILFFSLLVLASGCANYRLGVVKSLIPAGYSIQVGLFQNTTIHSGLSESVNASIRRELQRDGTFELANSNNCDLHLTGRITSYQRSPVSFRPRIPSVLEISLLSYQPKSSPLKNPLVNCLLIE